MLPSGKYVFRFTWVISALVLLLMIFSSVIYALFDYTGLSDAVKPIRLGIIVLILLLLLGYLFHTKKLIYRSPFVVFLVLVIFGTVVSIISNGPRVYIPTVTRYLSYIFIANLFYRIGKHQSREELTKFVKLTVKTFLIISIIFGYFEIISGRVDFINGDFRVAGPFRKHQLAFAMFLFANLILHLEFNVRQEKRRKNFLIQFIIFLLSFYLFVRTGSRALFVIFFLSYFGLYLLSSKNFKSALRVILIGLVGGLGLILVILYTNISPRLKLILVSETSIYDPSTMTRLLIYQKSWDGFQHENQLIGIGIGGFAPFYSKLGGEMVAAHNNYLLFLIETGYIGLVLYLLFQAVLFRTLLRDLRRRRDSFARAAMLVFIGVHVMSFLLNNFYFFTTELIIWAVYGMSMSDRSENQSIYANKT